MKFEKLDRNLPQLGDYILFKDNGDLSLTGGQQGIFIVFLLSNIGKVTNISTNRAIEKTPLYRVKYNNVPKNILHFFWKTGEIDLELYEIECFSKNKENIELRIQALKYNL